MEILQEQAVMQQPSLADQLEKLTALLESGALTQAEFAAAKEQESATAVALESAATAVALQKSWIVSCLFGVSLQLRAELYSRSGIAHPCATRPPL